jgi:hypothetical protein
VRGIYFATHFGNWYVTAPEEEVCAYLRVLAARGTNHLMLWLDLSNCYGLDSPEGQALLARLRRYFATARALGMRVGLARVANEAWRDSPPELRADPAGGRGAIMLSDLCPARPAARTLLAQTAATTFALFDHLDFLCLWPYDSGGCACADCQPWGSRGFLIAADLVATAFHRRFPAGQIILSTWFMTPAEWQALRDQLAAGEHPWVGALLAEHFRGDYPPDLLAGETPRGLPLLGFPEISMAGMTPWGGCGANPRPAALAQRWQQHGRHLAGGFPYSEGCYEDANKALYAGLYLQPDRPADEVLADYLAREFSPAIVADGLALLHALEATLQRHDLAVRDLSQAGHAWALAQRIHAQLPAAVATDWRWQVLYLRARLDHLLARDGATPTPELTAAFAELHALYHTTEDSLLGWLLPPFPPQRTSPDPRNLAAGCPVTASSTHPDSPGAAALTDDVLAPFAPDHGWRAADDDATPTLTLDLGTPRAITAVALQPCPVRGKNQWYYYRRVPAHVTVAASSDGVTYATLLAASRDVPVPGQLYKQWFYRYPAAATARYLRLTCATHPGQGLQLAELRVYGPAALTTSPARG